MQEAAAEERFEDAARYRNRLFAIQHLAERQAADRRVGRHGRRDRDRGRGRPRGRADLPAARRQAGRPLRVPPRERRRARTSTTVLEAFCLEYYGSRAERPAADRRAARRGRPVGARGVPLRAARRAGRGAHAPSAARSGGCSELADAERALALESDAAQTRAAAAAPRRGARGAARGAQPREPADPDRVLRHLERSRARTPVGSMVVFQDALPKKAHYRKFGDPRPATGMDDFAAMAEVVSRRFARLARRRPPTSYDESFAAVPNLVVDRRRQGPARRRRSRRCRRSTCRASR